MWTLFFLLCLAEPAAAKPWWVLFADDTGGYWVDAFSGKALHDVDLAREKRKPVKIDPTSQLVPPPIRRYRNRTVTTAKGVTVRELKNRLQLETKEKKSWLTKAGGGREPRLRPDGKALAFLRWDGKSRVGGKARVEELLFLDLATKKSRILVPKGVIEEFAWAPDGRRLEIGRVGRIDLLDVATAKILRTWKLTGIDKRLWNHAPTGLVFHPASVRIATRCVFVGGRTVGTEIYGDHKLIVLSILSAERTRVLDLPPSTCEGPIRGKLRR